MAPSPRLERLTTRSHGYVIVVLGAAATAALINALPSNRWLTLLVYSALALAVVAEARIAYLALPVTIPWGSTLPLVVGGTTITPSDIVVAALLLTWLVGAATVPDGRVKTHPWLIALSLLIVAMVVSLVGAWSVRASVPEIAKWLEVLVVAALAPVYLRTRRDLWVVVAVTVGSAAAESVLGLVQFLTHSGPKAFEYRHRFLRAYGTFGQPNPLAGYLNMVLPLAVAAAYVKRSGWVWLAAGLIGLCSLATLSRAGWVAGCLGLFVVSIYFLRWVRPAAVVALMGGLLFVLSTLLGAIPVGPLTKIATSFGLTGINFAHHTHANFSEIERAAHWVAGIRMFLAHPITGVGIGNYSTAYPAYHVANFTAPLGHAHDYFINIAAEAGIIGLCAYTLFVMAGFATSIALARKLEARSLGGILAIAAVGLWTSSTFHNLFDVLYVHEMSLLIAVVMGCLIAVAGMSGPVSAPALEYAT